MQSCAHSSFLAKYRKVINDLAKYRKVINDDRAKLHLMKGSIPALPISNHRTPTEFKLIQSSADLAAHNLVMHVAQGSEKVCFSSSYKIILAP
jgi:hypothetical protein